MENIQEDISEQITDINTSLPGQGMILLVQVRIHRLMYQQKQLNRSKEM